MFHVKHIKVIYIIMILDYLINVPPGTLITAGF